MVAEVPKLDTTQVPTDLTVGTSTDCSEVYAGTFSNPWLGVRTSLRIQPLLEKYADTGEVGFIAWVRADIQVTRPDAFAVITGVRP